MGKFAEKVKSKRVALQIGVRELAGKLGVSPGYVSRVEVRDEIPSPEMICKLGEELDLKAEELLELAREDIVAQTKEDVTQRHTEALRLFRRRK